MIRIGRPDDDFLNQPITAFDHPILRAHAALDPNSNYLCFLNGKPYRCIQRC